MQVDSIKVQDYMKTDEAAGVGVVTSENAAKNQNRHPCPGSARGQHSERLHQCRRRGHASGFL